MDTHRFLFDAAPGHRLIAHNVGLNVCDLLAVELQCSCGGFTEGFTFNPVWQLFHPRYVELAAVDALAAFRVHAAAA